MPPDTKRFCGPENSTPYKVYTKSYTKSFDKLYEEILDKKRLRKDKRELSQPRPIFAKVGVVSQAKGSAYVELQNTKVICSVFDPREIPHQNEFSSNGQLYCELKFATFSCWRARRQHAPDNEEKSLSAALKQALEPAVCRDLFPNFQVDVIVYVLENDGSCLAAAINAAGLALADAVVPMYDIITASTLAIRGDKVFIDPTEAEEYVCLYNRNADLKTVDDSNDGKLSKDKRNDNKEGNIKSSEITELICQENQGVITMSALTNLSQISDLMQVGCMNLDCVSDAVDTLNKQCEALVPIVQQCLVKNLKKGHDEKEKMEDLKRKHDEMLQLKAEELKAKHKAIGSL